jgi:ParB family chromosome partitioning protein
VELLKSPQIALRVLVASVISRDGLWEARPESQNAQRNEAIAASMAGSRATAVFDAERDALRALLGLPAETYLVAQERGAVTCPEVLARLLGMSDEEMLRILTFLMAEALPAGSTIIEVLGHLLAVDMDQWWSPDEAFFELLRDKEAINAMLAEVAGKQTASIHLAETAKTQKDAIRHSLAGTGGRRKVEGWKPRYFRFPMQAYSKGLAQIDRWNAVRKLFEPKQ